MKIQEYQDGKDIYLLVLLSYDHCVAGRYSAVCNDCLFEIWRCTVAQFEES